MMPNGWPLRYAHQPGLMHPRPCLNGGSAEGFRAGGPRSPIGGCAEVKELAQCVEIDRPIRSAGEFPGADGRRVQNLAVDGGRCLDPFLLGQARQPAVQPHKFGIGELPDLCVHRSDDGRGRRLLLLLAVRGGVEPLGGGVGAVTQAMPSP